MGSLASAARALRRYAKDGVTRMGVRVTLRRNEPVEKAMRRLKKTIEKEGLRRDAMRHRYYESKSVRRRRTRHKNARKMRRAAV